MILANLANELAASSDPRLVDSPISIIVLEKASTLSVWIPNCPADSATVAISEALAGNSLDISLIPADKSSYEISTLPFVSTTSSTVFFTPAKALSKSIADFTAKATPPIIGSVTPLVIELPKLDRLSPTFFALVPIISKLFPTLVHLESCMAISLPKLLYLPVKEST